MLVGWCIVVCGSWLMLAELLFVGCDLRCVIAGWWLLVGDGRIVIGDRSLVDGNWKMVWLLELCMFILVSPRGF